MVHQAGLWGVCLWPQAVRQAHGLHVEWRWDLGPADARRHTAGDRLDRVRIIDATGFQAEFHGRAPFLPSDEAALSSAAAVVKFWSRGRPSVRSSNLLFWRSKPQMRRSATADTLFT